MKPYELHNDDCLEIMKTFQDSSIDMVLCDLPYNEVSQKSSGLRMLDRGVADVCDIDLSALCKEFDRICVGTVYAFCGTQQISDLIRNFKSLGYTTRVGVWDKTNPSPMNREVS